MYEIFHWHIFIVLHYNYSCIQHVIYIACFFSLSFNLISAFVHIEVAPIFYAFCVSPNQYEIRSAPKGVDYYFQDSLDQSPMPIKIVLLIPMPINSDKSSLRSIGRNWLKGISDQFQNFDRYWSALGIDWRSPIIIYMYIFSCLVCNYWCCQ